jgi:putative Ca2+/H+ antiporter (TMEM165/GDT1 family)
VELSPLLLGTAFVLVMPAELPDKTMFATLVLATRYRPLPVLLGVAAAFAVQCVVAVVFGSVLTLLPHRVVALVTCLLFLVGAVLLLRGGFRAEHEQDPDVAANHEPAPWWRVATLSFGVLFAAEWGDASQIATAALTARYGEPLSVGLGSWLALMVVGVLAVLVGKGFAERLPTRWLHRIAGAIFVVFAILAGLTAIFG